jgi:hypothetical protein
LGETKNKVICFRLSSAEYNDLENACRQKGFHSVPLFVRAAVMAFQSDRDEPRGDIGIHNRIALLKRGLDDLALTLPTNKLVANEPDPNGPQEPQKAEH